MVRVLAIDLAGANLALCLYESATRDFMWQIVDWTVGNGLMGVPIPAFVANLELYLFGPYTDWFNSADVVLVECPYVTPRQNAVGYRLFALLVAIQTKYGTTKVKHVNPATVKAWLCMPKRSTYAVRKAFVVSTVQALLPVLPPAQVARWQSTIKKDDLADALLIALWWLFSHQVPVPSAGLLMAVLSPQALPPSGVIVAHAATPDAYVVPGFRG